MARGEIIIAASHYIAGLIADRHQVDPARIRVIPRGVDPSEFDPDAISSDRIAKLARDWRLPDGARTVVLPGRLTSWKGHTILLDAIARLGRQNVLCVLVGSPQGRHHYVRQAGAAGHPPGHRGPATSGRAVRRYARGTSPCRTWSCTHRPSRKPSVAWSSRRRPCVAQSSPPTSAARWKRCATE